MKTAMERQRELKKPFDLASNLQSEIEKFLENETQKIFNYEDACRCVRNPIPEGYMIKMDSFISNYPSEVYEAIIFWAKKILRKNGYYVLNCNNIKDTTKIAKIQNYFANFVPKSDGYYPIYFIIQ